MQNISLIFSFGLSVNLHLELDVMLVRSTLSIITNTKMIAVNQDPLDIQGKKLVLPHQKS